MAYIRGVVVTAIRTIMENKLMIDSGSFILLVRGNLTTDCKLYAAPQGLQLVSAFGESILVLGQITLSIQLEDHIRISENGWTYEIIVSDMLEL